MANVLFTRTSDPSSKPITDGQLIFDTSGNGKMYLDVGDKRLEMGGAINIDSTLDPTSENPIQNKAVAGVMLSTLEEIDKVTSKGKLTDALATKELNTKVTDLETDVSSLTNDYISKGKILGSLEEVTTATDSGFVPDALAIKELDTDLQGQIDTLNSDLKFKYYKTTVTATNASINIPSCKEVLSVQNSDASISADQITSWVRQSSTTLYYNKSGTASTQILILYIPL